MGYAKTGLLQPGEKQTVTVTFDQEQLKSYDYVGAKTYILDAGEYYITAAADSHAAVNNILAAKGKGVSDGMTAAGNAELVSSFVPANATPTCPLRRGQPQRHGRHQPVRLLRTAATPTSPQRLAGHLACPRRRGERCHQHLGKRD